MLNQRSDKIELLRISEAVANEKSIDKEVILTSMESAIQKAAKTRFGSENNFKNQKTSKSNNKHNCEARNTSENEETNKHQGKHIWESGRLYPKYARIRGVMHK